MEFSPPRCQAALANLPNELLSIILTNFCVHCCWPGTLPEACEQQDHHQPSSYSLDLHTLYSTCLVSRRLRDVAQPILYHQFVPAYGDSGRPMEYDRTGSLTSFLRTVTLRRDLANLVREVYLSRSLLSPIDKQTRQVQAALEESASLRGINLADFLDPFRDPRDPWRDPFSVLIRWSNSRKPYHPAAEELVAMLLSALPNISRLYYTGARPWSSIPAAALRVAGVQRLPLHTIDVNAVDEYLRGYLGGILEMSQSTLTTLHIRGSFYRRGSEEKMRLSGLVFPSLQHISLTHIIMSDEILDLLLSGCVGLSTFIYDAISTDRCDEPSSIIRCLRRHQETLKTLRLDLREAFLVDETYFLEPMPTLQPFQTLLDVSLNSILLYNEAYEQPQDDKILNHLLPQSIISLQLYDIVGTSTLTRLSKSLANLADAVSQGRFPHLRRIECYAREKFDGRDLHSEFASVGVHLVIGTLDPPADVVPRRRISSLSSISSGASTE